jgi:glycosyltransferase involved in cell wall biosynthesis
MTEPAITVLIDTYNHERFIEQAITSAFEQDFPHSETEIIVVDDGSTDRTPEIVRKFGPRVRLLRKDNGGQASAFNSGIAESKGDIVAFLDGDDWWAARKLSAVARAFEKNREVGVIGHGIVQVDENTQRGSVLLPKSPGIFDLKGPGGAQIFRNYMCFLGTSRVAIRKSILQQVIPIPESLRIEADEFMSAVAIALSGGLLLAEPLTNYRLHDQNLYQFREQDKVRMQNKMEALRSLANELSARLQNLGISGEAISVIADPIRSSVARTELILNGGWPWQTYRVERAELRHSYAGFGFAYRIFKELSLAATLLVPPRTYYRLRSWYGASTLRKWRGALGEPEVRAKITERRVNSQDGLACGNSRPSF